MGSRDHEISGRKEAVSHFEIKKADQEGDNDECRLRRAFLLVDTLHGMKRSDEEILRQFREHAISHQVILSKVDRVLFGKSVPSVNRMERNAPKLHAIVADMKEKIQPGTGDGPEALGEIVTCSAEKTLEGTKIGINNVRWAVLAATGLGHANQKILLSDLSVDNMGPDPDIDTPVQA